MHDVVQPLDSRHGLCLDYKGLCNETLWLLSGSFHRPDALLVTQPTVQLCHNIVPTLEVSDTLPIENMLKYDQLASRCQCGDL